MISKKELLIKMHISYGQLYRWKREGLIPDEWFIKQSVSTGQETFFDEELIIPRIEQILNYKDKYQFDEMKDLFSKEKPVNYDYKKALTLDVIDPYFLKIYLNGRKDIKINELAVIYILTELDGTIESMNYLKKDFSEVKNNDIIFVVSSEAKSYLLIAPYLEILDQSLKIIKQYKIEDAIYKIASLI